MALAIGYLYLCIGCFTGKLRHNVHLSNTRSVWSHFLSRRLAIAILGTFAFWLLWLSWRCIGDPCYLQNRSRAAVVMTFTLLSGWLFAFIAGNKHLRIALVGMVFFALFFLQIRENNIPSVAVSLAAQTLRVTREKLEQEHSHKAAGSYPAIAIFAPDPAAKMFYRFEYLPLASKSMVNDYMLKARPLHYSCGITRSFLVDRNGKFHTTQEDRDATESDPILE